MSGASHWLAPLMPGIPGVTALDARRMNSFERALGEVLSAYPIGPSVEPQLRSQRLARIRRELALGGYLGLAVPAREGGCGGSAVTQALMQFIVYVAYGTALTYGIDLDAVFHEVHRSNMSKLGSDGKPLIREDGKVLKSERYFPPDIESVLRRQEPGL